MKIKIFGFELNGSEGLSVDGFFESFAAPQSKMDKDHLVAVKKDGKYWCGLFLTIRDQKAFCRLRRQNQNFVLKPESLGADRIADFNYFIFNPQTNRGLYQWYHQSGGVGTLSWFLKRHYNEERDRQRDAALTVLSTEEQKSEAAKRFKKTLHHAILCRQESIESKIRSLAKIKSLNFSVTTFVPAANDPLAPLSQYLKRKTEQISFNQSQGLVDKVAAFAASFKGPRLTVDGVDDDGHEQVYKLLNDHDVFQEFDYDNMLDNISLNSNDLGNGLKDADLIQRMLALAEGKAKAILTRPAR